MSDDKTFRILSIDGGGVRGIFAAKILELIETKLGVDIRNTFDLIVICRTNISSGSDCD